MIGIRGAAELGFTLCLLSGFLVLAKRGRLRMFPIDKTVFKIPNDSHAVLCMSSEYIYWKNPKGEMIPQTKGSTARITAEQNEFEPGVGLFINNITWDDAGEYTCLSKNSQVGFNLSVIREITFNQSYAVQYADEDKRFILKCGSSWHSGNWKIFWKVDGELVRPYFFRYEVQEDGNLLIRKVTESEAKKKYVCGVMDDLIERDLSKQMEIVLKIKTEPEILPEIPMEGTIQWGIFKDIVKLNCSADRKIYQPIFSWRKDAKIIPGSGDTVVYAVDDYESDFHVTLDIKSKFGQYECRAKNLDGLMVQVNVINLREARKPSQPFLKLDTLRKNVVMLRMEGRDGYIDEDEAGYDDLDRLGIHVQYKMLYAEEWKDSEVIRTATGFILGGLEPNEEYAVRAAFRNKAATGDMSEGLIFRTKAEDPSPSPNGTLSIFGSVLRNSICLLSNSFLFIMFPNQL